MRTIGLALLVAFFTVTTFEAAAAKKKSPSNKANIQFQKGNRLYKAKKYDLAAKAFHRAYQFKPRWKYLFHIGQSEAAAKRPVPALAAYESYLAKGKKKIPVKRRKTVRKRIVKLRAKIGELDIQAPEGATVFLNGQEIGKAPLAKPVKVKAKHDHTVRVVLDEEPLQEQTIRVAGAETTTLVFEKPAPPPMPMAADANDAKKQQMPALEIAGWSTLAGGAALLIAATVTGSLSLSLDRDLENDCQDGCPNRQDDIERRDNLAVSTNCLLAFGGAAAVAGSVILIISYAQKEKATAQMARFTIRPLVGAHVAGAAFQWKF